MFEDAGIEMVLESFQTQPMRYLLPFLLVFVIIYGVLQKIGLFKNNTIDGALSVILSLIVIGYTPLVEGIFYVYITQLFGGVAILLLSILAFFMLATFLTQEDDVNGMLPDSKYLVGGSALIIIIMIVNYGVLDVLGIPINITFGQIVPFIVLGGVVGFMALVMKGDKDPKKKTKEKKKENP